MWNMLQQPCSLENWNSGRFKRQKQSPNDVLKIFVEMCCKLNEFLLNLPFCSFKIFHWYLITNLIISKDFSLGFLISTSPYYSGSLFFWQTRLTIINFLWNHACTKNSTFEVLIQYCGYCAKKSDKFTKSITEKLHHWCSPGS